MSQWGKEIIVDGGVFVPNVDTGPDPFRPLHTIAKITDVVMLHDGGRPATAEATLGRLRGSFTGRPYALWLQVHAAKNKRWDGRFMALARFWADLCSKDPRTKVGAVLVGVDRRDVALGFNGFPRGVRDLPERLDDRDTKNRLMQHAERNVLDNAHFDVEGGTLFVTMFTCSECAKSIAQRRIARVVCPPPPDYEPWLSDAEWTRLILGEGGVALDEKAEPSP